jgi:AraC-like DNA-binding protein
LILVHTDSAPIDTRPANPISTRCAGVRPRRRKGIDSSDYQTELRMRIAVKLLESTTLSIGEIAERTRHSEPTNFTAAFKKYFAVLPREVRHLKEGA